MEFLFIGIIVIIAAIYLYKKLHTAFTKPYEGCTGCSCQSHEKCNKKS